MRDLIHEDHSGAKRTEDVNWWHYSNGWKNDLDDVSYHRKADDKQAPPTL